MNEQAAGPSAVDSFKRARAALEKRREEILRAREALDVELEQITAELGGRRRTRKPRAPKTEAKS
jgi:prefoldin subunit 5